MIDESMVSKQKLSVLQLIRLLTAGVSGDRAGDFSIQLRLNNQVIHTIIGAGHNYEQCIQRLAD